MKTKLKLLVMLVCATANGLFAKESPATESTTWARFLTKSELTALAAHESKINDQLKIAWPEFSTKTPEGAPLVALGVGVAVWAGKQVVGLIADKFRDEAKKHEGLFSAIADGSSYDASDLDQQYVAIELRRDEYSPIQKNLFQAIVLIRPLRTGPNKSITYQLLPIYWKENEPAAQKVWGGGDKHLTSTLTVTLSALWQNGANEPMHKELISAQWIFKKYSLGENIIDLSKNKTEKIAKFTNKTSKDESDLHVVSISGLAPSAYFTIPLCQATLTANLNVAEVDSSMGAKILKKLGDLTDSQKDKVGELIKSGLE